jgi:hypothetical protein
MTYTKRLGPLLALSSMLLVSCSGGEPADAAPADGTPARSTPAAPTSYTLSAGTLVDAELIDTITSRRAQAGQAFTARVVSDVTNAAAMVTIPAGSIVHGTIVEVSPAQNPRSTGTLTLTVSSVTVRGSDYDIEASIDSLRTTEEGRGVEGVDVARVAGGAAAGAIIGRVIGGDAKGAIIGGVAGGAAGAVVSAVMRDVDIVLPAGAHLMLTLLQPLTVAAR